MWCAPGEPVDPLVRRGYHNHHVPRLLHQLGFSVQRPRKRLARADRKAQEIYRRATSGDPRRPGFDSRASRRAHLQVRCAHECSCAAITTIRQTVARSASPEVPPGRRTLTEMLSPSAPSHSTRADRRASTAAIRAAAERGIATPSSRLPHDGMLQRVFGRHDLSAVQAHTGDDAAASARSIVMSQLKERAAGTKADETWRPVATRILREAGYSGSVAARAFNRRHANGKLGRFLPTAARQLGECGARLLLSLRRLAPRIIVPSDLLSVTGSWVAEHAVMSTGVYVQWQSMRFRDPTLPPWRSSRAARQRAGLARVPRARW
jgi:hypothetical protein